MPLVSVILSLYDCRKYLSTYLQNVLEQSISDQIELSIVHNSPRLDEKLIIEDYKSKINIKYQEVDRESLYKSWNKAIKQSTGKYLVCWNVDDLREKDSIYKMVKTLDENKSIGFTYGDFIITKNFGTKVGEYINTPDFKKKIGLTSAIGGPFFMWRKNLIPKVGYFDEQFLSGADLDYTIRLSKESDGKKTNGLIGYFLNDANGLSTKNISLQTKERTLIEIRHNINFKRNLFFNLLLNKYDINQIEEFGIKRTLVLDKVRFTIIDFLMSIIYTLKESLMILIRIVYRFSRKYIT
jgi:cellulose synthase/poly-beta-1,6-N-acetylglucosamine synthase-like glycosyltransferase